MQLTELVDSLFAEQPSKVLYHYTSLGALMKIVASGSLHATEIGFFSDAAEMKHAADILRVHIAQRIEAQSPHTKLLSQLREWIYQRLTHGHLQFVVSFIADGNLLSQWRGYCPHGRGVSIGFQPDLICQAASAQGFRVGKCIYESGKQKNLVESILTSIENLATQRGENTDTSQRHASESFHDVFEEVEGDLVRIAALLKHGTFNEEQEWRIVSPIITEHSQAPIEYREGRSMLIPFMEFFLQKDASNHVPLEHVFLGPTPNVDNSMTSLTRFLTKHGANPKQGVSYCQIPYREH